LLPTEIFDLIFRRKEDFRPKIGVPKLENANIST